MTSEREEHLGTTKRQRYSDAAERSDDGARWLLTYGPPGPQTRGPGYLSHLDASGLSSARGVKTCKGRLAPHLVIGQAAITSLISS